MYPNGNALTYAYDDVNGFDNNLSRITSLNWTGGASAVHAYLGLGTVVQVDDAQPGVRWNLISGSGTNPYAGFDQFGRIINSLWQQDSGSFTALDQFKYGYDLASNRLWRQNVVAGSLGKNFDELYAYDGLYQLKDMQRGQLNGSQTAIVSGTLAFHETWGLDQTGNWGSYTQDATGGGTPTLAQSRDANRTNEITEIANTTGPGWIVPQYDAAGNMTRLPQPLNPSAGYDGTWDAWNRLVKLTDGDTVVAQFAYDGLTRRVRAIYTTETRHFYYSANWQILEERLGASPNTAEPDRQFVWGLRYIDNLILRDRTTEADLLAERMYAMQDANWNVTAICDRSGNVQERYAYSAYGVVQFLDADFNDLVASAYSWETLYAGYRYDSTSLYCARMRLFHSEFGVWISRDPLRDFGGRDRFYVYVNTAPTVYTDPAGMKKCCVSSVRRKIVFPLGFHMMGKSTIFGFGFTLDATFGSSCDCECCSFRQFVNGQSTLSGRNAGEGGGYEELLHTTVGGVTETGRSSFVEDIGKDGRRYGHRNDPPMDNDKYTGQCSYYMDDAPGIPGIEDKIRDLKKAGYTMFRVDYDWQFWQQIIDTCNNDQIVWQDILLASAEVTVEPYKKNNQVTITVNEAPTDLVYP